MTDDIDALLERRAADERTAAGPVPPDPAVIPGSRAAPAPGWWPAALAAAAVLAVLVSVAVVAAGGDTGRDIGSDTAPTTSMSALPSSSEPGLPPGDAVAWAALPPTLQSAASPVLSRLRIRLEVPATARTGEVLRYRVVLINDAADEVVLEPCPAFQQGLPVQGLRVQARHTLNCAAAEPVPAGGEQAFDMQLSLPPGTAGTATLYWGPNEGGTGAQADIAVTGPEGERPPAPCNPDSTAPPCTQGLEPGRPYPVVAYTHCGFESIWADGREWRPEDRRNDINPPFGWDGPDDYGTVELVDRDVRLVYTASTGQRVEMRPVASSDLAAEVCY